MLSMSHYTHAEETDGLYVVPRAVEKKWTSFNLSDIRLSEGSYFKEMQDLHLDYLLSLDPERLLNNVLRGGDIPTTAENYGGWQHDSGNGFSNYMAGCAMMYASTGDARLYERIKWMIDQIADCQEKEDLDGFFYFGRSKGAASYNALMAATGNGVYPSNNGEDFYTNSAMAGMAFYQLHRIFYGIRDVYYYTGYEKAKNVFLKCMEWACKWTDLIPEDAQLQIALEAEHGGMAELFVDAYALTGDKRFLDNADRWTHSLNFRDQLAKRNDVFTSRHANAYAPKFMGLVRNYEFTGNEQNRDAALNTWDILVNRHMLPNGGFGRWERFGEPGKILDELANTSSETCVTNNMLRFSKAMFSVFGESKYLDYYERALYNHILASKDPDNKSVGGGFCYYQSLMPGQCRKYMDDNSFYCCWETGLENHSKYGEAIYFHNGNDILINLYIPSTLQYEDKGFSMRMEGNYPLDNEIKLTVLENTDFDGAIQFRCPQWLDASRVKVSVNGQAQEINADGDFIGVRQVWQAGDVITLSMPLELRYELSEEPNVVSLFYGPLVIVPDLENVATNSDYVNNVWDQQGDTQIDKYPDFPNFDQSKEELSMWMKQKEGTLEFTAQGVNQVYTFVPFYQANHMRTSIYQRFVGEKDKAWEDSYIPDRILFNVNEIEHAYGGRTFLERNCNRYYRHVAEGRSLSYTMKLSKEPGLQHWIAIKHQGWETEQVGNYDVYIDDVLIGSVGSCERLKQFTYPTVFFRIPLEHTNGKSSVNLKIMQKDRAMNYYGIEIVTDKYLQEFYPASKYVYESSLPITRLEAELTQPNESNRTFDGLSSAGAYVSRLNTYLQFNNVFVKEGGVYHLSVCYRGSASLKYNVTVNNVSTEVQYPSTSGEWVTHTTEIELQDGFNVIHLAPTTIRTPHDVDYIELQYAGPLSFKDVLSNTEQFYVCPNPSSDFVFFKAAANWKGTVSVVDMLGKPLYLFDYPDQNKLAVDGLPNGVYMVAFDDGKDCNTTRLVVYKQ